MIGGINKNMSEKAYRKVMLDSSSSLKDFCIDRRLYQRRYILGEVVEDKFSQAILMGQLVDLLLLEPHLFDEKFAMSACASSPTGLMMAFIEALYKYTKEAMNEEGEITKSFEEISKAAYEESGFKIKYETVITKFAGSDAEIFYNELLEVRMKGLTVVTTQDVTTAEIIVEELKNNYVTKDIVNLVDSDRYVVRNQFQIEGYDVYDHKFKSMIDKVVFDYTTKTIDIYDLKCIWSVEGFYEDYYLYRRSYLQAYLYWKAVCSLTIPPESEWYGYTVHFPKFIVCDSINYYNPLIYELTFEDLKDAYEGFEYKGRTYPGVKELIVSLKWAQENNIWNISMNNYNSNGVVKLK